MSYFAVDAEWSNGPEGTYTGHDEIRDAVKEVLRRAAWVFAEHEIRNLAITGNVVLTERVDHWATTDRRIDLPIMGAFEITGNKISAWRDYFHATG